MPHTKSLEKLNLDIETRTKILFEEHRQRIYMQTDRLFSWFLPFQWLGAIASALWVSPRAWSDTASQTHFHVWAAILLGGLITLFPAFLAHRHPGKPETRYLVGVSQMLIGALLIHLTGGRIETHFHVFGSLAFLAFYRDWKVLVPATLVVAFDHWFRGVYWPQSVYGIAVSETWRWLEHAGWVVFEDIFLIVSCLRSKKETWEIAVRTARDEYNQRLIEAKVIERTAELKKSQEQLLQAQKMESLGQLSASIAHDLNNQLTPVRGYLDMILSGVKPDDPNHPLLVEVNQAAIRSVEIVQRLLNFPKPSTIKKSPIQPERLIEEIKKMIPQLLPSTIETSVVVEGPLWDILGNETELQTVIVNLIANARDAMPNGGALTLRAENANAGGVTVSHGLLPVPHVVISIVDSGMGMTPEVMQRVFEPFFSTKGRAKGAGLGLSMAFQIVKAHDGWIDISTELGKGSAFQIYLPAIVDGSVKTAIVDAKKTGEPSRPQAADQALPRGKGLILFVDDEERLRTMGKYFLEGLGYSVMLAKDGSDAVEKYVENQKNITAVVSDMTMPRMTGKQMLIEILGINSKAIVILSSGYTDEGTHDDMIALGAADFFQKPYTIKILADSLHRCLTKQAN